MAETMATPHNKADLLIFMQGQWDGFVAASDALPDDVWLGPVNAAGWNIRDHVAHVMTWTRAEAALLADGTPILESTGMPEALWNAHDGDAINEWIRQSIQTMTPAEVRVERDRAFPPLIEVASAMPEDDFAKPVRESGLEDSDRPLLEVMSENFGLHFEDHRNQIEQLGKTGASA